MSAGLPTLDSLSTSSGSGNASVHKMPSSSTMRSDEDDEDMAFDSPEDEIAHYREKCRQSMDMLTETRAELEEFQQSSKELEDEMEQELASNEKVQGELKEKIKRLEIEKEEWKSKQIALQKLHSSTTAAMHREMDNLRSERDKTLVALRDLEMGNDELERNERVAVSSLLDLESKYNRAIEEKTLLEQEIVQKQEMEEECQRLKDEMRDANNEISILRDQISRMTLPTPPSSISEPEPIPISPIQDAYRELPLKDEIDPASIALPPPVPTKSPGIGISATQSPARRLPRSTTSSSIPLSSPVPRKRLISSIPQSPTMSSLSRSTTSRNLAGVATGPQSPALTRSRSGIPQPSPARITQLSSVSHQQTKSRGFKLLHDLQARLKATDNKLGVAKVPRRNVSNPLSFGGSKSRTASASSMKEEKEKDQPKPKPKMTNPRVTALNGSTKSGDNTPMTSSNSSLMSPNGWVLIDGEEDGDDNQDTPTANAFMNASTRERPREEPLSPLDATFGIGNNRAVSSASNQTSSTSSQRSLPSRPGIPSPLANINGLNRSTSSKIIARPPSRSARSNTTTVPFPTTNAIRTMKRESQSQHQTPKMKTPLSPNTTTGTSNNMNRPMSPSYTPTSSRPMSPSLMTSLSRPMSPSMLPQLSRPLRAPSPQISSTHSSRPSSRTDKRLAIGNNGNMIGKGPPPPSFNNRHPPSLSASTNLRRSTRRSSLGAAEASLPPTGIPAPRDSIGGVKTPVRPMTIHGDTPPPVPRIPSGLRRKP
ncbi:uncharacterized protein IL334_007177 [Kwoniella shivajii]|uniref:NUDE domain-containing protein n=1 Tax=Kwoniella shivajii TaxID=564305 RepID=A0ABZ1D8R5_9TREE|nr:hypothetical protein IL334_007177 [Kwoniella shivajii]